MERNLIVITLQTMFQADFISALGHDLPQDGVCVCYLRMCVDCWCLAPPILWCPAPHPVPYGHKLGHSCIMQEIFYLGISQTYAGLVKQTDTHTPFFTANLTLNALFKGAPI